MADPDEDVIVIDSLEDARLASDVPLLDEDGKLDDLPPGAVRQDDGSVIYTLRHPCTLRYRSTASGAVREETFPTLHLHRLNGADMRAVTATANENMLVVAIARSARMNEAKMKLVFDRMDGEDAAAAGEIVSGFLGTGRKTGR